jgi:hypothetical protein
VSAEQPAFRIEGPGGQEIGSLADWLKYAPPKKRDKHWKPGRSAMELARAWLDDGHGPTVPAEVAELLESHDVTRWFVPERGIPEWVTTLDDFAGEHRNHDLVVIGEAAGGRTLLAVEAKADESYGDYTVDRYLRMCRKREVERVKKVTEAIAAGKRPPRPSNAAARIKQLCAALFGPPRSRIEDVAEVAKPLRYQLITALAGALIEARERGCEQAVLIVHEFVSDPDPDREIEGTNASQVERNARAFHQFVEALTSAALHDEVSLAGPYRVPGSSRVPGDASFLLGKVTRRIN